MNILMPVKSTHSIANAMTFDYKTSKNSVFSLKSFKPLKSKIVNSIA